MSVLVGTPSDDLPEILATGRSDITTVFVSMTARHPEGRDADYIEWHCLDHRPEMHRLASMRASLRLVSTPGCRAARAASEEPYDRVDHVMSYLMASDTDAALEEFRYLDDDPVDAAERLRPVMEKRWTDAGVVPLLAAPFHTIAAHEWGRYVP